ncbi:putative zinc-binding peptidase [Aquimarina sp. ERC-38]|uniref:zinc-binding metallopeptidase family protein n=1 Tax=Aquimarina sp. ERC-38 TaxID=2949996 RepID=UPI0022484137|nr:putative zinc-binding peptidase [Aquimarina sp. ERC-38]UZO81027.1 putative zinc-binding peptidase [Aquimarina sp. ERC-38]
MKTFHCSNCDNPVYFENTFCEKCHYNIGYDVIQNEMLSFDQNIQRWKAKTGEYKTYHYCQNQQLNVCNWLIPEEATENYCKACSLNRTIPDISDKSQKANWYLLEQGKHRLIYQLLRLNLPVESKLEQPNNGLCFDFLSNQNITDSDQKVMTGHAEGVITITLSEADTVQREKLREQLNEPYRTIIGHFRHEVGHYYWERIIVSNQELLEQFRNLFGDERSSYADALDTHYKNGAPSNWDQNFISSYASAHPWEDWAETWAHYLHFMDTLETAFYTNIQIGTDTNHTTNAKTKPIFNPYKEKDFDVILDTCIPLYIGLNNLNRSMGIKDIYPFVVNITVVQKLKYIHQIVRFNMMYIPK